MKAYFDSKALMFIFSIYLLFLLITCEQRVKNNNDDGRSAAESDEPSWTCSDKMDRALIKIVVVNNQSILDQGIKQLDVNYQNSLCVNCDYLLLKSIVYSRDAEEETSLDSYYAYRFQVTFVDPATNSKAVYCERFDYKDFGECGQYVFEIGSMNECSIKMVRKPINSNKYLWIALAVCIVLVIISNVIERFGLVRKLLNGFDKMKTSLMERVYPADVTAQETELRETGKAGSTTKTKDKSSQSPPKKKTRLLSLDTFRGFSLAIMIVVNYGSGGYKVLSHLPWNGVTIADMVFPWFLWIMGVSIVLSTNVLLRKPDARKLDIFFKIVVRFVKMFAIGIMLNSRFGVKLYELRIFGVLQRIALCYLVVALVELACYRKINVEHDASVKKRWTYYFMDIFWPWKQWIIMSIIFIIWFLVTYLLDVPGCGRGYIGPGGLDGYGKYANCTGGAAGYVDRVIFGRNVLYKWPSPQGIFKTIEPFDPEGIMGTFNSIILTFLGVQAGRVLVFYESHTVRLVKWGIWTIVTLVLFLALTQADMQNGLIPVNKNLWTPTYTFFTAFTAFAILIVFYLLIDVKPIWSGNPFIYPGMNSILIYICHAVFRSVFPVYWIVSNYHGAQLAMAIWGSTCWILVSMYLYHKRTFVNL